MTFAVPASMAPLPLTFLAFGGYLVEASAYQTGAIFVAMIAAHATTTGLGFLHRVTGAPTRGRWGDFVPGLREPLQYGEGQIVSAAGADVGCRESASSARLKLLEHAEAVGRTGLDAPTNLSESLLVQAPGAPVDRAAPHVVP